MSLPLATAYFASKVGDEGGVSEMAWNSCIVLTLSSISVFTLFFATMEKEYRKTFFSTERGKDLAMRRFLDNSDDAIKADAIFWNSRRFWVEIEDKVEDWVRENWNRWMEEGPEWFDDNIKSMIPSSMIPIAEDQQNVEELQEKRRRSSLLGSIVVSGRRKSSLVGVSQVVPQDN